MMPSKVTEKAWIERVRSAYVSCNYPLATKLMEQALIETKSAASLLEIAGMMAYERGQYQEAIRLIEAAMFEVCLSISGQLTLANACLKVGNVATAETTLSFLVECVDRVPCAMLLDLTHNLVEIGRDDLAIEVCRAALSRHPGDDNAAFGVGFYIYRSGGSLEWAQMYMSRAVELNPLCSMYRVNLAIVHAELGQWAEAYFQTTQVQVSEVRNLSCGCLVERVKDIYLHFEDYERLAELGAQNG
ncbi:MAG: tetratricopeptide repeat protein [Mariniblastus sp.]|nr:tetratricopeptide repeat protein [Mariniblastus sp.]